MTGLAAICGMEVLADVADRMKCWAEDSDQVRLLSFKHFFPFRLVRNNFRFPLRIKMKNERISPSGVSICPASVNPVFK